MISIILSTICYKKATLKALYLSDNKLEELPPEFTNLTKLETVIFLIIK